MSYTLVNLGTNSYTFDFVGAQPGRWRVWAVDVNGQKGPKSDWWGFSYPHAAKEDVPRRFVGRRVYVIITKNIVE